ncbi:uncharacterized protein EV422DRAFT_302318 [Fimicolochytrium jonesii]|uniref:uncharacterized protein n=1 Tax=Fimicolochytrium jonesii TaxID=1396493 RepID=UPI0022FE55FF|nr:uncharacterized protein EV422DRAFT_302318 [Fimicolochytrium jonesii]KAI8823983.1 hypothetical protein EV422DRAFT_302318 [Fimicolochytrium jonesii]
MPVRPISPASSATTLYQSGLTRAATSLFPEYRNLTGANSNQQAYKHSTEVSSYLPLQILLFFNVWLFPLWTLGMIAIAIWKTTHTEIEGMQRFLMAFALAFFVVVECLRLWFGYKGNLLERVPELAGHFLLTLFPQCLIAIYLAFGQRLGQGSTMPIETVINMIYVAFLVPEALCAYIAARNIIRAQSARFFLNAPTQMESRQTLERYPTDRHDLR